MPATKIGKRDGKQVRFEHGLPAALVAIDGTWRRACLMLDIAESGATLTIGAIAGLQLTEFFLLFSSIGVTFRRCEMAWVNGDQLGVSFISHGRGKKSTPRSDLDQFV
jgi:hypothetical protein